MFHCSMAIGIVKTDGSQVGEASRIVNLPFVPHAGMILVFDDDRPSHEVVEVHYFVDSTAFAVKLKDWQFHESSDLSQKVEEFFGPEWSFELLDT